MMKIKVDQKHEVILEMILKIKYQQPSLLNLVLINFLPPSIRLIKASFLRREESCMMLVKLVSVCLDFPNWFSFLSLSLSSQRAMLPVQANSGYTLLFLTPPPSAFTKSRMWRQKTSLKKK